MRQPKHLVRNILVLWRWQEAEYHDGEPVNRSIGGQMKGLKGGDKLFVCTTRNDELYLMGVISVSRTGKLSNNGYYASGASHGPFCIFPLGNLKWKLRFENTESDRLSKTTQIAWQVRRRRFLTYNSASLLLDALKKRHSADKQLKARRKIIFEKEGAVMYKSLAVRERDQMVRKHALLEYGRECKICGIDFEKQYGPFARDCVEVHHLNPVGQRTGAGHRTALEDVIVICPNCHRALHASRDPSAWQKFRRDCGFE